MTRVLSVQTPLLGNRTYGELLRRMLGAGSDRAVDFRALWSDAERVIGERTPLGRVLYRIFFTNVPSRFVRERNADFYAMRYELGTSYWTRRLLEREFGQEQPDVLHVHTQGNALLLRDVMRRVPTVISADMTSRRTAEQFTRAGWRWTHGAQHALEGAALREAAALVAFSQYAARSMVADYGVDPDKVFVIPPGIDLAAFGDPGAQRSERNDGIRRILFVGGEFERKGGFDLIAAYLHAFANRDDVELHVVTDASTSLATEHPRIVVHRNVAAYTPQWRALYERASVIALPSRREAYGFVYLEAGAARLPVVGSSTGAGPELVLDGETGFLVPPGDVLAIASRLVALVDDPVLARRFGEAARARVERDFDAARNVRRLAAIFISVDRRIR